MSSWYYAKNGQKIGPIESAQLRSLAVSGQLGPDDMVLQEGRQQWSKASSIKGLFPTATVPQHAIPTAPPAIPTVSPAPQVATSPGVWRPTALVAAGSFVVATIVAIWFSVSAQSYQARLAEAESRVSKASASKPSGRSLKQNVLKLTQQVDDLKAKLTEQQHDLKLAQKERDEAEQTLLRVRRSYDAKVDELRQQLARRQPETKKPLLTVDKRPDQTKGPGLPDEIVDRHALQAPKSVEQSVETLAKYLADGANTDRGRVRAVFRWITDRISYNHAAIARGSTGDNSVEGVLQNRTCVCMGYSNLFHALCQKAGVESVQVFGHAKGSKFDEKQGLSNKQLHAWNAVKLDGKWHLADSTFGAGIAIKGQFKKQFRPEFFLAKPEFLAFSHLPHDEKWQLLDRPLTKTEFLRLSKPTRYLNLHGIVTLDEALKKSNDPSFRGYVKVYRREEGRPKYIDIPIEKHLKAGKQYSFRIESSDFRRLAINNNDQAIVFTTTGNMHEATVTPVKGLLRIGGLLPDSETKYGGLLEYIVE